MKDYDIITVLGPTASGKTQFAVELAYLLDAEIISADSRQVYRRMDIGTGKDLNDYFFCGKQIPYHLIDIVEPGEKYNLYAYQRDFLKVYEAIKKRNKGVIVCGGSGLYIESILRGYNLHEVPQNNELRAALQSKTLAELKSILASMRPLHNDTDTDSCRRAIRAIEIETYNQEHANEKAFFPKLRSNTLGILVDRETRRARISQRLDKRLKEGMVDEVKQLLAEGISEDDLIYYGLEYKYVTEYVVGKCSYQEMYKKLEIAIHQFAKRQMTWFRGMERRGINIHWIEKPTQAMSKEDVQQILAESL